MVLSTWTNKDNPSNILGFGTWTQITGYFLYPAPNNETIGDTGGSWWHNHTTGNHTLTTDEMPSHSHNVWWRGYWSTTGSNGQNQCNSREWQDGDPVQTFACDNNGGNQPHNHGNTGDTMAVPPFVKVRAWYRTA